MRAQRIDATAGKTEIAGRHREIGHAHDHGRTLAVLGHAEPIVNGAIFRLAVQARGIANDLGRHAGDLGHRLGRVFRLENAFLPGRKGVQVAAFVDVLFVEQALAHDNVGKRIDDRNIGTGQQRQMIFRLHVR